MIELLDAIRYPHPPRPPDRRRFGWESIRTTFPQWTDVESALRRLDRDEWPYIWLHRHIPPDNEADNFFCVFGGRGEYHLRLCQDGHEIVYFDPSREGELVRIWESDQGLEVWESNLCSELSAVFEITRFWIENDQLHPAYSWRE